MSQSSGSYSSGSSGPDFRIPDEILSVMPTDPYEQLDLARKITSMAIAARVSKLESEVGSMRQRVYEKDRRISELEDKVLQLERSNQESENRLKIVLDENVMLSKERDSLATYAKKLNRDLMKLETFKRQLIQSLSDDNSSLQQAETVDIETCDQPASKTSSKDESTNGHTAQHPFSGSTETGDAIDEVSKHAAQRFSITPYISPRLTPTGTPKIMSISGTPKGYSTVASPQMTSGATSPTKTQTDGRSSLSSWYSSSQQSSAANSPPRGHSLPARTPRIDGKEFFRQARSRLSYEQFSAFLANIKELNAQRQSREETLKKAEEIFGVDNKDLYLSFQGLLNRSAR